MKLRLLNASSELLFSVDVGNLPETYGADSIKEGCPFIRYHECRTASRRTGINGTNAPSVNSHLPTTFANWGLPKSECLKKTMCNAYKRDKSQGSAKGDDTENLTWQRSPRSSPRTGKLFTWRRRTV